MLSHHDTSGLSAVAFSPGGERLAIGDHNKTIHIWDLRARLELLTLVGHVGAIDSLAFTPDGHRLYSADKPVPWGAQPGGKESPLPTYSIRIWDATPLPDP
jgi:WD40 repeat protein